MEIESVPTGLRIRRTPDGPVLVGQNAQPGDRPHLHPVLAPDGVGEVTEDRPAHHPWQRGLYVGLNAVNGDEFWTEGLLPEHSPRWGSFEVLTCVPLGTTDATATWTVRTRYRDSGGDAVLLETQTWTFIDGGHDYLLDLDWRLEAVVPVVFGAYPYGGPFLRMPFREDAEGLVLTSEGATSPADADQARARWVAVCLPLPGRAGTTEPRVTVTAMDRPGNPQHPVPWRVDDQLGVGPGRCIAGEWRLAAGEATRAVHRFAVSVGPPDRDAAESAHRSFVEGSPA